MVARLHEGWQALNASYWFVPMVLALAAVLLSVVTLAVDARIDDERIVEIGAIPFVQSDGARAILTTVASSMITVGGVVFSLTLLVLTQASSQFGPRLLVNFMRDRTNQVVLGTFVATYVYSLLVLRVVTGGDSDVGVDTFVPQVSVLVALIMTFVTVGALVFFFHHIAQSIRVTHILASVGRALDRMLERLPELDDPGERARADEPMLPERSREDVGVLAARHGGYLQEVDVDALVEIAAERDAVVSLVPAIGRFVMRGAPLAEVYPATATDAVGDHLHDALVLGEDRSVAQDPGFLFDEFLEIALRALSPSMNDPFTARSCIDRIGEGILLLDRRRLPHQVHEDDAGVVRAFVPIPSKGAVARHLFTELRLAGRENLMVAQHLVTTLVTLHREVRDRGTRIAIEEALDAIVDDTASTLTPRDHALVRAIAERGEREVGGDPEPRVRNRSGRGSTPDA